MFGATLALLTIGACHLVLELDDYSKAGGDGGGGASAQGGGGAQGGGSAGGDSAGGSGGSAPPVCGDGIVNGAEECDGGGIDTAVCDDDCTTVVCGDNHVNTLASEACDDGNTSDGDGCSSACKLETCGDGTTDAGEECDEGNNNDDRGDCTTSCLTAKCGDGLLHDKGNGGEGCDDGNGSNTDACPDGVNGSCQPADCGDGFVWAGKEGCDDQNSNNHDACLNSCVAASCGDGVVHNKGGGTEMCDDNNTTAGDGCNATCKREKTWCCAGEPSACVEGPFMIGADNLGLSIPDGQAPTAACASYMFAQKGCGPVSDVDVVMGVTHSRLGELGVWATHPAGSNSETLLNFNSDLSDLNSGYPITFDDSAATSAGNMGVGIGDTDVVCKYDHICDYHPDPGSLVNYDSMSPAGNWQLCVGDTTSGTVGTLQEVRFIITTQ